MYSYQPDIFSEISESSTDDDIIEIILSELNRTQKQCHLFDKDNKFMGEQRIKIIVGLLQHHNLAQISGQSFQHKTPLTITQNGTYICNQGGWLAYNSQIKHKQDQETDLRIKEVNASLLSADAGKKSMYASYIAIGISLFFAVLQSFDSSNKQAEIDTLKIKVRALDSLSLFQLQRPKPKTHPVDSTLKHKVLNDKH